jgi:hypothetical protein
MRPRDYGLKKKKKRKGSISKCEKVPEEVLDCGSVCCPYLDGRRQCWRVNALPKMPEKFV